MARLSPVNVRHLESFYYVAKHGGISAALRHFPYGVQQPAVSGQMRQLEEDTGVRLFERVPFRLTPAGERLFDHLRPFFENLDGLAAELKGLNDPVVRMGGSEFVLREHIPVVISRTRSRFPALRFSLRTGFQVQLEEWLRNGELDLAATLVSKRPPARLRHLPLANVPLVLLVPKRSPLKSAEELWAQKKITVPLVALPPTTILTSSFIRGLKRKGIVWPHAVEAGSIDLITRYVGNGDGYGVNMAIESVVKHPNVRALPLHDFEPLTMGLVWRGEPSPVVRAIIEEVQRYSRETWPDWFVDEKLPAWGAAAGR